MLPRRRGKVARTTLILATGVIASGQLFAGLLIDRSPLEIRFPEALQVIHTARQQGCTPDIIFFGTSRFANQYDAPTTRQELALATGKEAPCVLNAGISWGDPVAIDFLIGKLLDTGIRPSLAVIEVSPETVSRRNFAFAYHLSRQLMWADVLHYLPDVVYSNGFPRLIATRFTPVYFFRQEFRQWAMGGAGLLPLVCCPDETATAPQTQAPRNAEMPLAERLALGASLTKRRLHRFQIGGFSARALERVVQRYQTAGVTTLLLAISVSSPLRETYVPEIDAAFLSYMDSLRKTYGVHFMDYRDRIPDRFFKSGYYTTEQGTQYVTRLLAREVLAPLWQNKMSGTGTVETGRDLETMSYLKSRFHAKVNAP